MEEAMDLELNPIEQRILGCLIEKEMATPEYYPLTLNALVNACNQKSNRNPVMELDSATVEQTLYELRTELRLAIETHSSGSRVSKYKHNFSDHWDFTLSEMAILCELFVRGPQTPGDLRAHASRLRPLTDANEVDQVLKELESHEGGPFVIQLPREPGKRERRWAHLFSGEPEMATSHPEADIPTDQPSGSTRNERMQTLEDEITELRQELDALKTQFEAFKTAFE
jgi:uncharacterized protein YceH (UPF0502 family)